MNRRQFLQSSLLLPLSFSQPRPRPNIILIVADDLGYSGLGCYGQELYQTPCIDALAAGGLRFTQAYSQPICSSARWCLEVGKHIGHAGTLTFSEQLTGNDRTIADELKEAGYTTGLIGKWGAGDHPNNCGYDEFLGFLTTWEAGHFYPTYLWYNRLKIGLDGQTYFNDILTTYAVDFADRYRKNPFFLFLSPNIPHSTADGAYPVPTLEPYEAENWPEVEKGYAASIWQLDQTVRAIVTRLQELGLDRNTLIIFTSDNGPLPAREDFFGVNGGLRGEKGQVYEAGIRMPFVVSWPGIVSPGGVCNQPVNLYDIYHTAVEIAGGQPASFSFLPWLYGLQEIEPRQLYFGYYRNRELREAVRWGNWKLVRVNDQIELFNLADDWAEANDLSEQEPGIVRELIWGIDQYCPKPKTCRAWIPWLGK